MISIDLKDIEKGMDKLISEVDKDLKKSKKKFKNHSGGFRNLMVNFLKTKRGFVDKGHKAVSIRIKNGNIQNKKPCVYEVETSKNLFPYTTSRGSKLGKSKNQNYGMHYVRRRLDKDKVYNFRIKRMNKKMDLRWNKKMKLFCSDTINPSHTFIKHMPEFENQVNKKMKEIIGESFDT